MRQVRHMGQLLSPACRSVVLRRAGEAMLRGAHRLGEQAADVPATGW